MNSGISIRFVGLDPYYRRKQTRMNCSACGSGWWYTPGQKQPASEHWRPDGRRCRKGVKL